MRRLVAVIVIAACLALFKTDGTEVTACADCGVEE